MVFCLWSLWAQRLFYKIKQKRRVWYFPVELYKSYLQNSSILHSVYILPGLGVKVEVKYSNGLIECLNRCSWPNYQNLKYSNIFIASFHLLVCYIKKSVAHVFVGPLSPEAALIVKSCDTIFSANIFCITVEIFTIPLWLWNYWKVVPNWILEPRGALERPLVGLSGIARRLISKVM